eukprot:tig00021179_g19280.t1
MERPWPERRGAFISGSAGCRNPSIYIDCSSLEASAALITCDATIPVFPPHLHPPTTALNFLTFLSHLK